MVINDAERIAELMYEETVFFLGIFLQNAILRISSQNKQFPIYTLLILTIRKIASYFFCHYYRYLMLFLFSLMHLWLLMENS